MTKETLPDLFESYVKERKKIHENDTFSLYKKWEELTHLLSKDETETVNLIQNATQEEIILISEVMEDVSAKLNSDKYLEALHQVNIKYPDCNLDLIIETAMQFKNKK